MVNHGAAALLMASLLAAVAFSGADARPTVHGDAHGKGFVVNAVASAEPEEVEPTCHDCEPLPTCDHDCEPEPEPKKPEPEPEPEKPEPEPEHELKCKKAHGLKEGETCESVAQCAGLDQDHFLRLNPNLECCKLFVGQWLCVEAECDE